MLQVPEEKLWHRISSFPEWQFYWYLNETRDKLEQVASSLLHYLPEVARCPFLSWKLLPSRLKESDFWQLVYHWLATSLCVEFAFKWQGEEERFIGNFAGRREQYQICEAIKVSAQKALVVLGRQGFWGRPGVDLDHLFQRNREAIWQRSIDTCLGKAIEDVIRFWANGLFWHQEREPAKETARRMVEGALKLRARSGTQMQNGDWQDELACRAAINTGHLPLLVEQPTEIGLETIARALEGLMYMGATGVATSFVVEGLDERDLRHAFFEIGFWGLNKTREEMYELFPEQNIAADIVAMFE